MVNARTSWCDSTGSKSKRCDKILMQIWNVILLNFISFLDWVAPVEIFLYGCYWAPTPERMGSLGLIVVYFFEKENAFYNGWWTLSRTPRGRSMCRAVSIFRPNQFHLGHSDRIVYYEKKGFRYIYIYISIQIYQNLVIFLTAVDLKYW